MTVHDPVQLAPVPQAYRFTQRDYLLLSENGAFDDVAKAELIEGEIVILKAQYSRHVRVQTLLFRALADGCDRLNKGVQAWLEGSFAIDDQNMPEPDIFVSRGLPDDGPITLDRMLLVVEIADSTLQNDLGRKQRLYAAAGVPEYWVADVNGRVVHRMSSPTGDGYAERIEIPFGTCLQAATIPGLAVDTAML